MVLRIPLRVEVAFSYFAYAICVEEINIVPPITIFQTSVLWKTYILRKDEDPPWD